MIDFLKTIGFGDLAPKSEFARAVAIVYIPIAVGSMGFIMGKVASSIVETKMADFNKKLWSYELTIKDIEALDEDNEGGGTYHSIVYQCETYYELELAILISLDISSSVDALEYTKFMLCAMKKIDADLFEDLQFRFKQLDKTGDGKLTKEDLMSMLK